MKKSVVVFVEDGFWLDSVEEFVFELMNKGVLIRHLRRKDARVISTESMTVEIMIATGYNMRGKRADLVLNLCHSLKDKSITPKEFHEQVAMPIMMFSRGM